MSKLVIRKRVTLEFLGDEYKDAFIDFKSIPVGDYDKLIDEIKAAGDGDNQKANSVILGILKEYYLGGKFPNEQGTLEELDSKDELDGLDKDALLECFGKMTGQDLKGALDEKTALAASGAPQEVVDGVEVQVDPKSEQPSKLGSTTANQPPQK